MGRAMCMAVAFMLATAVVQAHLLEDAPLMMKNPNAMLTELERMVRAGETPAFSLIATIKNLIQDDIMPGLESTREAAEQDTAAALSAIQSCNTQSKTQEDLIAGSTQESVNAKRIAHADCREAQKDAYYHNLTQPDSYCVKLGEFLHDAKPLSIEDGLDRASSVQYVLSACETGMCDISTVTELDDNCTAKEQELESKGVDCFGKQSEFEVAFCGWKTELEENCDALDTCYNNTVTAYGDHVTKTKTLVQKWNVESGALHKILCYCNVWLSEKDVRDNRSQHNATQFDVCMQATYTADSVNYGTPEAKIVCDLSAVDNHPGTSGFITQEYGNFTDFFDRPVIGCEPAP